MANNYGRLEAQLTADATWTVSGSDSGGAWGPATVLAAGATSFPSDLCTTLQTIINAASLGPTYTVSPSFGETGTGRVTISASAGTWSLTWNVTNLRDAVGFTGNIVSVSSPQTGVNSAKGVWIPSWHYTTIRGQGDDGHYETDLRQTESPLGHVKTIYGNSKRVLSGLVWPAVGMNKTLISGETITNESFERFWLECLVGDLAYCSPGPLVRFYWDAAAGTTLTGRIVGMPTFQPAQVVEAWSGQWRVEIPRFVKVPA